MTSEKTEIMLNNFNLNLPLSLTRMRLVGTTASEGGEGGSRTHGTV